MSCGNIRALQRLVSYWYDNDLRKTDSDQLYSNYVHLQMSNNKLLLFNATVDLSNCPTTQIVKTSILTSGHYIPLSAESSYSF